MGFVEMVFWEAQKLVTMEAHLTAKDVMKIAKESELDSNASKERHLNAAQYVGTDLY